MRPPEHDWRPAAWGGYECSVCGEPKRAASDRQRPCRQPTPDELEHRAFVSDGAGP